MKHLLTLGKGVIFLSGCYALYLVAPDVKDHIFMKIHEYPFANVLRNPVCAQDACALLPHNVAQLRSLMLQTQQYIDQHIARLLELPELDFERFELLDHIRDIAGRTYSIMGVIEYTHPDEALRNAAHTLGVEFGAWLTPRIDLNPALYAKLEATHKKIDETTLDAQKQYYITEVIKGFQRSGVHLPAAQQKQLQAWYDELSALSAKFERNIAQDLRSITAQRQELPGLTDQQCAPYLQEDGSYKLPVDYPTNDLLMQECSDEKTRQRFWFEFYNRGYPDNIDILHQVARVRQEVANMLGYPDFSTYQIEDSMAASPERVQEFLQSLVSRAEHKAEHEARTLIAFAKEHLHYAHDRMQPWDIKYIKNQYQKKMLQVDNQMVKQYFPTDQTIDRLLRIYEQFLGMRFEKITDQKVWHPDIMLIAAYNDNNVLLGHLFLDLYPRPGKFTHACHISMVSAAVDDTGRRCTPSVGLVIANFPKAHGDTPALLLLHDVNTFFHEFGHAVHALWGATRMRGFSGTNTKRDFVELPSQMLEEWLAQPDILRTISGHYQTGQPLPEDVIDRIIANRQWCTGIDVMRQLVFSQVSLSCFAQQTECLVSDQYTQLYQAYQPYLTWSSDDHFLASFGHLMGYGAQYYGYLWSKVFALDIFDTLLRAGLSPEIGARYRDMVLVPGGSQDPYEMISKFLGREPSNQAYFTGMGF